MKPYEEIILSYINKYHEIDLAVLSYELGLNISLLSDIIRNLYNDKFFVIDNEIYILTDKAKNQITSLWNEWSFSKKQIESPHNQTDIFNWDFLYIPLNFGKM